MEAEGCSTGAALTWKQPLAQIAPEGGLNRESVRQITTCMEYHGISLIKLGGLHLSGLMTWNRVREQDKICGESVNLYILRDHQM